MERVSYKRLNKSCAKYSRFTVHCSYVVWKCGVYLSVIDLIIYLKETQLVYAVEK